jgi:2-dehydro-3-deoxyphosphogluconate aldolase / (4S)-4-hydroxy-2-oxoglutarate aldolase
MSDTINRIAALKLIPMVVIDNAEHAAPFGDALVAGGLPIAEITFRTPAAEQVVRTLADRGDMLVGAGTILTTDLADVAIDAGAQFLVAPGTNPVVVEHVLKRGMLMVPGVVTSSEIDLAMSLGVTTLKFFPAETMGGVATLRALEGPYPDIRFIPTGGITPELLPAYLALPSVLACGGSWLAPRSLLTAARFDAITRLIEQAAKLLAGPPEVAT